MLNFHTSRFVRVAGIVSAVTLLAIIASNTSNSEPAKQAVDVAAKNDELLRSLKKRRVIAATEHFVSESARFQAGVAEVTPERICAVLETYIDAAETKDALVQQRNAAVRWLLTFELQLLALRDLDAANPGDNLPVKQCRIKAQVELVKECIVAGIAAPDWPVLPKGSPDDIAAGLIDDLGGDFLLDDLTHVSNFDAKELPKITQVMLHGGSVDDKTILALRELSALSKLFLTDTRTTSEGIAALKKHLPKLEVHKQNFDSP
jgi:hypothetical protein